MALRLDLRDYFNSIDVGDLLASLPSSFTQGPLGALLRAALTDRRVDRDGVVVDGGQKGVMAGTPTAPILATLYLRTLDDEVAAEATYSRYSDDILVLVGPESAGEVHALLRTRIAERGLCVNEAKSAVVAPGEPWDFLGFRYDGGHIRLAPVTEHKFRARTTRRARSLLRWRERKDASTERAIGAFVRRTNRRLYGPRTEGAHFSWATWFLPMLHDADQLRALDAHVQREARYVATGRRTVRAQQRTPYGDLVAAGYLPLVSAYWAWRESSAAYDEVVERRTGVTARELRAAELSGDGAGQRGP